MGTKAFILTHRNDDTRTLALQASRHPDVDMAFAIDQIRGWQKARSKLPSWAACEDITYPPPLAMEQCSSEQTARYKADLCRKAIGDKERLILADLTGGAGVDFSFLAPLFTKAIYIERQDALCQLARHNLQVLGIDHAEVCQGDAMELLDTLPHLSLLFIDPARRNQHGARTFAISDCTPDILPVLPRLLDKADHLMVKLSPMLDWHETLRSLDNACPNTVREIHIVATANECKELLVWLSAHHDSTGTTLCCINDQQTFLTDVETEQHADPTPCITEIPIVRCSPITPTPSIWLYEPNAAIMKAGCFSTLAKRFSLRAVSPNSHLFLSPQHIPQFPGRVMRIIGTTTMNKRQLRETLKGVAQANITTRNFPLTADQLRQRLRMADGGDTYLFATTTSDKQHVILICKKH